MRSEAQARTGAIPCCQGGRWYQSGCRQWDLRCGSIVLMFKQRGGSIRSSRTLLERACSHENEDRPKHHGRKMSQGVEFDNVEDGYLAELFGGTSSVPQSPICLCLQVRLDRKVLIITTSKIQALSSALLGTRWGQVASFRTGQASAHHGIAVTSRAPKGKERPSMWRTLASRGVMRWFRRSSRDRDYSQKKKPRRILDARHTGIWIVDRTASNFDQVLVASAEVGQSGREELGTGDNGETKPCRILKLSCNKPVHAGGAWRRVAVVRTRPRGRPLAVPFGVAAIR